MDTKPSPHGRKTDRRHNRVLSSLCARRPPRPIWGRTLLTFFTGCQRTFLLGVYFPCLCAQRGGSLRENELRNTTFCNEHTGMPVSQSNSPYGKLSLGGAQTWGTLRSIRNRPVQWRAPRARLWVRSWTNSWEALLVSRARMLSPAQIPNGSIQVASAQ